MPTLQGRRDGGPGSVRRCAFSSARCGAPLMNSVGNANVLGTAVPPRPKWIGRN